MVKNILISVLTITAFILALRLIQCRHESKLKLIGNSANAEYTHGEFCVDGREF